MIDTKGLRLDAAIARAGHMPMKLSGGEIIELIDRLEVAEKDIALKERIIDSLGLALNAAAHERDNLRAKVEQLTEAEAVMRRNAFEYQADAERLRAKIEAMERQKPVAFGLYSGWAIKAAYLKEHEACEQRDRRQLTADLSGSLEAYRVVPLCALPGAKGEEK